MSDTEETVGAGPVESKSAFARRCGVTPGRVTQWIAEGKIDGDALAGEGRSAQIRVALAQAQLRRRINVGQRFANGLFTDLASPDIAPASPAADGPKSIDDDIRAEKLAEIQRRNRLAARDELASRGKFVMTTEARAEMAKVTHFVLTSFEAFLAELANGVAGQFKLPQRDVLFLMRQRFREHRTQCADGLRKRYEGQPEFLECSDADLAKWLAEDARPAPGGQPLSA